MTEEDLYKLGFKDEIIDKPNGLLNYYLIKEKDNKVFIQISTKNENTQPYLITIQYSWYDMEDDITYLPINIKNIDELKFQIKILKKLFTIS